MSEDRCVWLAQCVCPAGHTIMAVANEADGLADAKANCVDPLEHQVKKFVRDDRIENKCGMCGAMFWTWRICLTRTEFATMGEAALPLIRAERRQQKLREQHDRRRLV